MILILDKSNEIYDVLGFRCLSDDKVIIQAILPSGNVFDITEQLNIQDEEALKLWEKIRNKSKEGKGVVINA